MIKKAAVTLVLIALVGQSAYACPEPFTSQTSIDNTTTLTCDKAWMDLQRRIKTARGFTGPNDYENSGVVIEAERMLAALNTFDGAAANPNVDAKLLVGSVLASEESLRDVVRAALLHVAFGKPAIEAYCEHLVAYADSPEARRTFETFGMREIREALQCGTN